MDRYEIKALDIAKEITVARVANSTTAASKEVGENIGDMFSAIYEAVLKITKADQ